MSVDLYDMDNKQHIRHNSESSNTSTSGYSTMSPGGVDYGNLSPSSSTVSMSSAGSPRTAALQTDFSNLNLPNSSPSSNALLYQHNYLQQQQQTALSELSYRHMSTTAATTVEASTAAAVTHAGLNYPKQNYTNLTNLTESATFMPNYTLNLQNIYGTGQPMDITQSSARNMVNKKVFLPARLQITEQPVDKFRFRYKSEMHGTHGSLTSSTSNRTLKRYPEVVLKDYNGPAKIRCSLFQANLDSPHSHQLVVRRDDIDICDPHELDVGPEQGFVAQFQNMGIIHTAKKYITNELLDKKIKRLRSQLGGCEISERQRQELYKETEKEAKAMNLNQVRLCFEAFREEPDKTLTPIAPAVYTNPINNRKSAQTGELRIVRLSIATGSAGGKDELILLVEKVSKKNIKVRFYELNDDELIWESYGTFRESDVHHQYAIVCQTPPYKDKQIEKPVDVFIELVRPSDDERSCPLPFRYKPLDTVISRKRRRTCSSANSSGNSSNNSFSSIELPETVTEQQQAAHMMQCGGGLASRNDLTISEEYNTIRNMLLPDSEELAKLCPQDFSFDENLLQNDGASSSDNLAKIERQKSLVARAMNMQNTQTGNVYLKRIFGIHEKLFKQGKKPTAAQLEEARLAVTAIYREHAERSNHSETLIHEIINDDDFKGCIMLFQILNQLKIADLLNVFLNGDNQSGLHCASFKNDNKYIHALLSLGCDPNIQDKDGNTAVHIAILRQNPKCIESFLKFPYKNAALKIDLTKKNYDDLTPLHLAIKYDQTATAKRLLQFDGSAASVCNSKDGNNALHMAILKENKDVVEAIKGARNIGDTLIMRNNAGLRPIDLAKQIQGSSGIYDTLEPLYMDMDEQNDEHQMIRIKEEQDMSSTSASDDEDLTTNEQFTVDRIKIENEGGSGIEEEVVDPIAVKTEADLHVDDDDSQRVKTLKSFLNDSRNYQKLAQRLNVSNRWKKLATMSLMSHLVCLWSSAEDMLDYIKNKDYNIEFSAFAEAVAEDLQSITER